MDQNKLIAAAIEGDSAAIKELYDAYKKDVYFLCHKLMGNGKDAASVLQYTFFQAFHRLNALKVHENFETWLYVISSNKCKTMLKEANPMHFTVESSNTKGNKKSKIKFYYKNEPSESDNVENSEVRAFISEAIDKMTEQTRIAVMMYFYGTINLAQISKILGADDGATKNLISGGVKQLEKEIGESCDKIDALKNYKNVGEFYTLLHREAQECVIAPELDDAIVNTAATLVMATKTAVPVVEPDTNISEQSDDNTENAEESPEKESNEDNNSASDEENNYKPDVKDVAAAPANAPMTAETKNAIRNLVLVCIMLILAIGIVSASIMAIKSLSDSKIIGESDTDKADDKETVTDTETSDETEKSADDTVDAQPVTEPVTDEATDAESETETEIETESETESPTDPVDDSNSMTEEEASKLFNYQSNADSVTIKKYIGSETVIVIPSSIGGKNVTVIDASAFSKNTSIKSVSIPSTVKTIGESAFFECTALTEVNIANGVTEIGTYAFRKCTALTTINIPSTVKKIGLTAFGDTPWYKAQTSEFIIVGDGVLIRYTGKSKEVIVPDTVKYISNAFYYNGSVETITIGNSVTGIGRFAFCCCSKLSNVTLSSTITEIDKEAFYSNSNLSKVIAPSDSYAYTRCSELGVSVGTN